MRLLLIFVMFIAIAVVVGCKPVPVTDVTDTQKPVVVAPPKEEIHFKSVKGNYDDMDKAIFIADDGCQYFINYNGILTHLGSCPKCIERGAERDSILLDKMLFEYIIKTNYEKKNTQLDTTMQIRKTIDSLQSVLKGTNP